MLPGTGQKVFGGGGWVVVVVVKGEFSVLLRSNLGLDLDSDLAEQ